MKKLFLVVSFIVGFLFIPSVIVFAASAANVEIGEIPIESYFVSVTALAGAVVLVTQLAKKTIKTSGYLTIALSFVISIVLSFLGRLFDLGIFEGITIAWVFIYGIAAAIIANWGYDKIIKQILSLFKSKTKIR